MESDDEFVSASEGEEEHVDLPLSKAKKSTPPPPPPESLKPTPVLKAEALETGWRSEFKQKSQSPPPVEEKKEPSPLTEVKDEPGVSLSAVASPDSSDEDGSSHSKGSSSGQRSLTAEGKELLAEAVKEADEETRQQKLVQSSLGDRSKTNDESAERKDSGVQKGGWDEWEEREGEGETTTSDWNQWGDEQWSLITPEKKKDTEQCTPKQLQKPQAQKPETASSSLWGWGGLVSAVGETFTSAIESGLGLPSGEEMAKRQAEARKNALDEQQEEGAQEEKEEKEKPEASQSSTSAPFSLFSGLVTGGIDVLESIGKKTFETITVREPAGGRRRFIFEAEQGQPLSEVLRELKAKAESEEKAATSSCTSLCEAQIAFPTEFGRSEGVVYLEALELLSNSRPSLTQKLKRDSLSQLTSLDVEASAEEASVDFEHQLTDLLKTLNLPYKAEPLRIADKSISRLLEDLDFSTPKKEFFEKAIRSLVDFTAQSIQTVSKLANLQLTMGGKDSNWTTFVSLYRLLAGRVTHHANQFAQTLSFAADDDEGKAKMNLFRNVAAFANNEVVRGIAQTAVEKITSLTSPTEAVKIETVAATRLNKMVKLNNSSVFGLYSESTSSGAMFLIIYLPFSKLLYSSKDEKMTREICKQLNEITDLDQAKDWSSVQSRVEQLLKHLSRNPDWQAVHFACACGFIDYLKSIASKKDSDVLFNFASSNGQFPIHIAAAAGQREIVRLLIVNGVQLNRSDMRSRNVVHYAAENPSDIMADLARSATFKEAAMSLTDDGQSPLSLAIGASNEKAVKILLSHGVPLAYPNAPPLLFVLRDVPYSGDLENILQVVTKDKSVILQVNAYGRTILHQDKVDKQILSSLLYICTNALEAKDKAGRSPLHAAAERGDLSSSLVFLSHGTDVNAADGEGNTPLHIAIEKGFVLLVKALIIFGGSLEVKNAMGKRPLDMSVPLSVKGEMGAVLELMTSPAPAPKSPTNVLADYGQLTAIQHQLSGEANQARVNAIALDGGGIRGLVLIQTLLEIEQALGGHSPIDYIDWIAGTSTGGILALALSKGKSLRYCQQLYFRFKDSVFVGSRPYNEEILEGFLRAELGADTSMAHLSSKKLLVTAVIGDTCPSRLVLFRSFRLELSDAENQRLGYFDPQKILAWKAARCSSAAPSYFSPMKMDGRCYMDGGLIANNPTCDLLTEILNYNMSCVQGGKKDKMRNLGCVLSIGTGKTPEKTVENVDLKDDNSFLSFIQRGHALMNIKDILIEQVSAADGEVVDRARAWAHSHKSSFFRFTPPLNKDIQLNETRDDVIIDMLWQSKVYLRAQQEQINLLAKMLTLPRR